MIDTNFWIKKQWGTAALGDLRRNSRAIKIAEDLLEKPSASFPEQCSHWGTLKAAYRFFNEQDITFDALQQPHRCNVIEQARQPGITLFIQDGSELDYTSHDVELGPIGNHHGHGFCLHTTLAVRLANDGPSIIGVAHQILWERNKFKQQETRTQRRARSNEADVWANSVKTIEKTPPECLWVTIGDRGADIFEFLETCQLQDHKVVIRMIQNRKVFVNGQEGKIVEFIKQGISKGGFELTRRGRDGEPTTRHELQLSWTAVEIQAPKYMGKNKRPIPGTYIRVWEEKEKGLEWILFTTLPVENLEQALEKVKWYSMRWIIEEYHKCLKTGCSIERRNFRSSQALEAMIGMFGIIAAKLLELKYIARERNNKLAKDVISKDLLGIIVRRYKLEEKKLTIKEFWKNVARLGGFIGRKSDGEPGWQTLWKGWVKLLTIQEALDDLQKCG